MPLFNAGWQSRIYVGTMDLSPYFHSADSSVGVAKLETTTFGVAGGAKTYLPGLLEGGMKGTGYFAGLATDAQAVLEAAQGSATGETALFGPNGDTVGNPARILRVRAMKTDVKTAVGGLVQTDAEWTADGGIALGVWLHSLSADTATMTGTTHNAGAATATGWRCGLVCTAVTGTTPSAIYKLQDSADGVTFADVTGGTFAALTAPGSPPLLVSGAGAPLRQYTRVLGTLTGTTPSFTVAVAVGRR